MHARNKIRDARILLVASSRTRVFARGPRNRIPLTPLTPSRSMNALGLGGREQSSGQLTSSDERRPTTIIVPQLRFDNLWQTSRGTAIATERSLDRSYSVTRRTSLYLFLFSIRSLALWLPHRRPFVTAFHPPLIRESRARVRAHVCVCVCAHNYKSINW